MPASKKETVSVVIPLYNAELFIAETIQSILGQTYLDFHIYVVDDFSTDKSSEIVQEIAAQESRVSYHKMPKKAGCPAPTKNEGIRLSKGMYIAFSDHDDWWDPEKLAKQVEYLENHPEVTLLGCNVEIVDTDRNVSFGSFWNDPSQITPQTIRSLVLEGPIFATTTCMIGRRDFLLERLFDEHLIGSDEYDLSLHAALDDPKQVALLPETLAYWRWHSNSLSHSSTAAERSFEDEHRFAKKVLARKDLTEDEINRIESRLVMVTRRAGNAAFEAGSRKKGQDYYKKAAQSGDRLSSFLLALSKISPLLTYGIVHFKRSHSHAKPTFR